MLPVAVLIWPIAHGATMPLVMPQLLIIAMPPARPSRGSRAVGMAQNIGNAEKIRVVATDSNSSANDRRATPCQ